MTEVLVDTSAWVAFFRGDKGAVGRIDTLVAENRVSTTGAVYAEVVSGAPSLPVFHRLCATFRALDWVEVPTDVWERVATTRFTLARRGIQATVVDLVIAVTASQSGRGLLTRDRDFEPISEVIPLDLTRF
jgi:predicted nucleic acid-binding protein